MIRSSNLDWMQRRDVAIIPLTVSAPQCSQFSYYKNNFVTLLTNPATSLGLRIIMRSITNLCNSNTEATWTNVFCKKSVLGDLDFVVITYKTVCIETGYGLRGRGVGVRAPAGARFFLHVVQTGSRTHSAFCPMGTRGSFSKVKAAGPLSRPLTSN